MQPCLISPLSKLCMQVPQPGRFYSVLSLPYYIIHENSSTIIIFWLYFSFIFTFWSFPTPICLTAMSFDLYAKYGNNRTLSLVSPKKPYYQWRLRVPSGHVVRLVILTLQGATPGSCSANKLSAYDFLLPLQNKIIARLVWHRIENSIFCPFEASWFVISILGICMFPGLGSQRKIFFWIKLILFSIMPKKAL